MNIMIREYEEKDWDRQMFSGVCDKTYEKKTADSRSIGWKYTSGMPV